MTIHSLFLGMCTTPCCKWCSGRPSGPRSCGASPWAGALGAAAADSAGVLAPCWLLCADAAREAGVRPPALVPASAPSCEARTGLEADMAGGSARAGGAAWSGAAQVQRAVGSERRVGLRGVAGGGGCAQRSVCVGAVRSQAKRCRLFVPPAPQGVR